MSRESKLNRQLKQAFIFSIALEMILMFINTNEYFQLSGWYYPLLIAVGASLIPIFNNLHRVKYTTLPAIFLLLLVLISAIINYDITNRGYALSYLLSLTILFVFSELVFDKSQLNILAISSAISGIIITLMMIVFHVRYYELITARITIQVGSGPKIDPNYLGGYLVSVATISLAFYVLNSEIKLKRFLLAGFMVSAFGVILTGSRGGLITIAVISFLFALHIGKKGIKSFIFIVILIIIGFIIISNYVSEDTIERLSHISIWIQDGSNRLRLTLWNNAWNSIKSSPIFGYGLRPTSEINRIAGGLAEPAHSTYLEMWSQLGILSIILFIMLIVNVLKNKEKTSYWIVIATVLPAVFISAECGFFFWFNIAVAIAINNMLIMEQRHSCD